MEKFDNRINQPQSSEKNEKSRLENTLAIISAFGIDMHSSQMQDVAKEAIEKALIPFLNNLYSIRTFHAIL